MTSEHNELHHQDIVRIKDDKQNVIEGNLTVPKLIDIDIKGIVIFAHGSGSSRHSQRNQYVAKVLNDVGIATLLIDLLTSKEEEVDDITQSIDSTLNYLLNGFLLQLIGYHKVMNLEM